MAYNEKRVEGIRELLSSTRGVEERRMFGGLAFLVRGHMVIAASGQGGLLVRINPDELEGFVQMPYVRPMVMRGRPMKGWLRVSDEGVRTKKQLEAWIQRGLAYVKTLPPKR